MQNRLRKHALDTYKVAPFSSWILGLTTGILIAVIIALDLLVQGMSFLTFPFLIVPIIFSGMLQHVILKTKGQISFSSSMKAFGLYYRRDFFGSFSILSSIFKGLLTFLIFEMTTSFILSTVLQVASPEFVEAMNAFYDLLESSEATYGDLFNMIFVNEGILFTYVAIVTFPALYLAFIWLIYNISRSSIVIYYKMHSKNTSNRFSKMVYIDVVRRNRMRMFKDYMMLNWPLYVLLAIGFGGGTYLGYLWKHDLLIMYAVGILGGAVLSMFFLPFYFGNQEALYDYYAEEFVNGTTNVANFWLKSLQNNIDLTIEEKERLEKSLSKAANPLEDETSNSEKNDEEQ